MQGVPPLPVWFTDLRSGERKKTPHSGEEKDPAPAEKGGVQGVSPCPFDCQMCDLTDRLMCDRTDRLMCDRTDRLTHNLTDHLTHNLTNCLTHNLAASAVRTCAAGGLSGERSAPQAASAASASCPQGAPAAAAPGGRGSKGQRPLVHRLVQ